jgi:RimJ/RimL family protein N-acetyltransferase
MNKTEVVNSIAYCGLICRLCHLSDKCDGCKSDSGCEEWKDCVHRKCCIEKNINGCFECEEAPCDKKMFANGHDIRIRAFIKFMKKEGPEKLIECLIDNEKKGLKYGYQKDYDFKESEAEVIDLLINGNTIVKKENPYEKCPVYETKQFIFRMVEEKDAEDLLKCYSDPMSANIFNSDNCTSNFIYRSIEEMNNCIKSWLDQYIKQYFVRFSIIDKAINKAIGTIEFFSKPVTFYEISKVGMLRLDLASKYEKEEYIIEIINRIFENFYIDFEVEHIITKAIPEAKQRLAALKKVGFTEIADKKIVPYDDYFIKYR